MRLSVCQLLVLILGLSGTLQAEELKPILLPPPHTEGGKPLLQALKERHTTREFKPSPLPAQVLADLLWAGFGINRPGSERRTAPSAMNSQEVDLYVALPQGFYLYDAKANQLKPVLSGDWRTRIGSQPFLKDASAVLLLVADLPRLAKAKPETRPFYAAIDAGCIVQNLYLFCASQELAAVVYDLDRAAVAATLKLKPGQQIMMAQAVGYPGT
ncbi:MAG TPA: SagB/ThcOx family dehydrogenase [Bacillota bacterium]|nr:SagB/ThcOx family dehydrogenase [Bacillota bacterium]